jgi:putative hydrolase of the HAD superfamily
MKAALTFFSKPLSTHSSCGLAQKNSLTKLSQMQSGLISNFTYAPVIHKSLRRIGIDRYFQCNCSFRRERWRKPSGKIFQDTLSRLQVQAEDAIYIGDSPIEDIQGAKEAGLKTMFVPSQFNKIEEPSIRQKTTRLHRKKLAKR